MEANIVNLWDLFEEDVSYRIPQFQRPYAWGKHQWQPLWDDVRNIAEYCLKKQANCKILPHFMGAIVLQRQPSDTGEVTKRLVVDGQQRLTTLQLLIKATEKAFQIQGDTARADRLHELITNKTHDLEGGSDDKTKILQSNLNDQDAFLKVIDSSYSDFQNKTRGISQAYSYFEAEVKDWLCNETEDRTGKADALEETLTQHLQIAAIDLDEDEEPHIIFETLNARGEPLQQSDLIKNTVMYEADVTDEAKKAGELWGLFDDEWWRQKTHETSKRTHIDRFLNYWLMTRALKNVSPDRVASEFRNYSKTRIENGTQSIETIAADIERTGDVYKRLENIGVEEIEVFLVRIKTLDLGVITPLLLWLYTSTRIPLVQRTQSIEILESYVVRRMLCGLTPRGLSNLFISLLEKLDSSDPACLDSTILQYLKLQTSDSLLWPNDRVLFQHLIDKPMEGTIARKKMILEAIEVSLRGDESEPLGPTDTLTVEHVMPQKWSGNWSIPENTADKDELEIARNEAVKNIGNLTLTTDKLNSSLSNGPWDEKRQTLDNHSSLFLNNTLLRDAPDVWDEVAIHKRSEYLARIILQIWPPPDSFSEP